MARFQFDPNRLNDTVEQSGREYNARLIQRSQTIFNTLMGLLGSTYRSTVQGPNYTQALKAIAIEIARLELALEGVDRDVDPNHTRSEFLYSIVGVMVLANTSMPSLQFSDVQFRDFFLNLIRIYFQGSVPKSMSDVVGLLTNGTIEVTENFLLVRKGAAGLDISDQFGFQLSAHVTAIPQEYFDVEPFLRTLINIMRPAHTLYRLRFVFGDSWNPWGPGDSPLGVITDISRWDLSQYRYEDFRKFCEGIVGRDRLGHKTNQRVMGESHGSEF